MLVFSNNENSSLKNEFFCYVTLCLCLVKQYGYQETIYLILKPTSSHSHRTIKFFQIPLFGSLMKAQHL